jgi:hypothetical protein
VASVDRSRMRRLGKGRVSVATWLAIVLFAIGALVKL